MNEQLWEYLGTYDVAFYSGGPHVIQGGEDVNYCGEVLYEFKFYNITLSTYKTQNPPLGGFFTSVPMIVFYSSNLSGTSSDLDFVQQSEDRNSCDVE